MAAWQALDWSDGDEGDLPLQYAFMAQTQARRDGPPLALTAKSTASFTQATFVPQRNLSLSVQVWDSLGASSVAAAPYGINVTSFSASSLGGTAVSGSNATAKVSFLLLEVLKKSVQMSDVVSNSTSILKLVGDFGQCPDTLRNRVTDMRQGPLT